MRPVRVYPAKPPERVAGMLTSFTFIWGDIPGSPDGVLLTGFKSKPVISGQDAKECKVGSRGTENFAFCKPRPTPFNFILKMKELGLLDAVYKNGQEFGPLTFPSVLR